MSRFANNLNAERSIDMIAKKLIDPFQPADEVVEKKDQTSNSQDSGPANRGRRRGRTPTLANQGTLRRYNLILPEELYEAVKGIAEQQHTTVIELFRKFIKLGMLAADIANDPKSKLIIREGKTEREIVLL